jgi:hypothetical protein
MRRGYQEIVFRLLDNICLALLFLRTVRTPYSGSELLVLARRYHIQHISPNGNPPQELQISYTRNLLGTMHALGNLFLRTNDQIAWNNGKDEHERDYASIIGPWEGGGS